MEFRLLADVPPEDVRALLAISPRRSFAKGEVVFHRDDPGDSLHLIVKGSFAVRIMTPLARDERGDHADPQPVTSSCS